MFSLFNTILWVVALSLLSGPMQYVAIVVGGLGTLAPQASVYTVCQEVVHPGLRATSVSLLTVVQNLLGLGLGPFVAGILSDKYGLQTALTITSLVPLVAVILFFIGMFFFERDAARVEKVEMAIA